MNEKFGTTRPGRRGGHPSAFTLVELMLAIGVIIALTAVTLPAFRAIQEGNREAGGVNAVSAALNTARSVAVREGHDVGVMFMFDTERQVCSMQLVEELGLTYDADDKSGGWGKATIFVPVKGQAPMELPQGAAVFGYGYGATRLPSANPRNPWNWYTELGQYYENGGSQFSGKDPWLFPRTDVRIYSGTIADADQTDMEHLESFIIRFNPDGVVVSSAEELASGSTSEGNEGYLEVSHLHTDNLSNWAENFRVWTPQIVDLRNGRFEQISEPQLRSVPFLAIVDLYKLAAETGIRAPWMTLGEENFCNPRDEQWDFNGDKTPDHIEIDRWINDNATVLTFNRYTGNIMKENRR